jgi:hypothetical protein
MLLVYLRGGDKIVKTVFLKIERVNASECTAKAKKQKTKKKSILCFSNCRLDASLHRIRYRPVYSVLRSLRGKFE